MKGTSAEYWFLDNDVIPRSPAFTSGNKVTPLIDGAAYMANLQSLMAEMVHGDYFSLAGWRVTPQAGLLGGTGSTHSIENAVSTLVKKGVTVRTMLWYVLGSGLGRVAMASHARENMRFTRTVNQLDGNNAAAIIDKRLPGSNAAHHQKSVVLSSRGTLYAFVGGTDICADRWDTPEHDSPPERIRGKYNAWHDLQCRIQGPATADIWDCFVSRWNERTDPHAGWFVPGRTVPVTISQDERPPINTSFGTHDVQVLQTLASGGTYGFAPDGEQTVRLALEKAIDRAEEFIYIEDQYLWPCTLTEKLGEAAARGVKIILLLAHRFGYFLDPWHNALRHQALQEIKSREPGNIYVYHLQQAGSDSDIYVHSKVTIIDDIYAAVGSANVNRRSASLDSELHLAIVDRNVSEGRMGGRAVQICGFAKHLRLRLWEEHLGIKDRNIIDDPLNPDGDHPSGWPRCANPSNQGAECLERVHHAVCHHVPRRRWSRPSWIPNRIMNPGAGN